MTSGDHRRFVNPGDKGPGNPLYGGNDNRSFEYDSLGDCYARFLIGELIPEVEKKCKGYAYRLEFGDAGHNLKHGGAAFPDTVRWLWRGYPKDPTG